MGEIINNIRLQDRIPYEDERGIFENQNIHLTWNSNESDNIITESTRNNEILVPILESEDTINNRHGANPILQTT